MWAGKFRILQITCCYFLSIGHSLRERLGVLGALNMSRYIKGYSDILSLEIVPYESFTRHELPALLGTPSVDGHMMKKLGISGVRLWRPDMVRRAFFIRMTL
jgi:hypothetical protein